MFSCKLELLAYHTKTKSLAWRGGQQSKTCPEAWPVKVRDALGAY
jgi:hypothetical protein